MKFLEDPCAQRHFFLRFSLGAFLLHAAARTTNSHQPQKRMRMLMLMLMLMPTPTPTLTPMLTVAS